MDIDKRLFSMIQVLGMRRERLTNAQETLNNAQKAYEKALADVQIIEQAIEAWE